MQTESGVKDKVAQGWIVQLYQKNKQVRTANPRLSVIGIKDKVLEWLYACTETPWNPLLEFKGICPVLDSSFF